MRAVVRVIRVMLFDVRVNQLSMIIFRNHVSTAYVHVDYVIISGACFLCVWNVIHKMFDRLNLPEFIYFCDVACVSYRGHTIKSETRQQIL